MFARFQQSWDLTKQSAAILVENKVLLLFPLMSALVSVVAAVSFFVPLAQSGALVAVRHHDAPPTTYLVLFLFYFCSYFITIFFNCALVGSAYMALSGGKATLQGGFNIALQRLGKIVVWALVAATVGLFLKILQERAGKLGRIVVAILGAAWSVLTYFIVPVIVFEDLGVIDGIKRSSMLVKKHWGDQAGRAITLFVLQLLGIVAGVAFAFVAFSIHPLFGLLSTVIYFVLFAIVVSTMNGVYSVALYRYCSQGVVPVGFSPELVQGAFVSRG